MFPVGPRNVNFFNLSIVFLQFFSLILVTGMSFGAFLEVPVVCFGLSCSGSGGHPSLFWGYPQCVSRVPAANPQSTAAVLKGVRSALWGYISGSGEYPQRVFEVFADLEGSRGVLWGCPQLVN